MFFFIAQMYFDLFSAEISFFIWVNPKYDIVLMGFVLHRNTEILAYGKGENESP